MARAFTTAGNNDLLSSTVDAATANRSIACWLLVTSITAGTDEVAWYIGTSAGYGIITRASSGLIGILFGGVGYLLSGTTATLNTWYQVTFTIDGSNNCTIYITPGGGSMATTALGTNTPNAPTGGFHIGGGSGEKMDGSVAECGYWTTTLTAQEALALGRGARCKDIRPGNLTRYYPCDGKVLPEPDLSGNHDNAAIVTNSPALASGPPMMQFTPRWPMGSILPMTFPPPPAFVLMPQIVM
jgi:hypothetical protein